MIVRAAGFKWLIDDDNAPCGDHLGPYHETAIEGTVLSLLKPDGVFLDVGAHVGHYTLRAAVKAAKVYAIEANPETFRKLQDNVELNGLDNVRACNIAAWDSSCTMTLSSPNGHARDGSTRVVPCATYKPDAPVQAKPLDEIIHEKVDLVKLDVEGADLHALRGMRQILRKHRPLMFIEDHSIYGYYERADLETLLSELGYVWHNEGAASAPSFLIAKPKQATGGKHD